MTPSCIIVPNMSNTPQCSEIFPSPSKRQMSAAVESIGHRLSDQSCRVIRLVDGMGDQTAPESTVSLDSGLPEELTPLTLAVLGQLLAYRVALARGIDPDRPRSLNKVTRTW